ncbi:unnamed protein product [Allacma fusca]|uniref:Uncharacterized protein n=1 Tax=Allacma fusca TaxID=39272 RepID=A0A8J2JJ31_9HEXA|nr:unnamed protein product [Allacma fusca]
MTGNITPSMGSGVNAGGSAPSSGPVTPSSALIPTSKESTNNNNNNNSHGSRRTHTIMSPEEANAGKRSFWSELELTGNIRNLSLEIFDLSHLTHLYINDNSLTKIPGDINRLVNLTVLDASNNKLRSLPPEIGDLCRLREFLLNNNYLRNFPCEMGRLFNLQTLSIKGNPLPADIVNLQAEVNGTSKLLTYLLDSLPGPWGGPWQPHEYFEHLWQEFCFLHYF